MNNLRPYEINQNNVTQTWLKINSNSTPTFNSIVAFDINQLGRINELCLLFNMSSITGVTGKMKDIKIFLVQTYSNSSRC